MSSYDPSPEQLYRQGLQQYNRADWQGAIISFTSLQNISDQYPEVEELLADARLKFQFSDVELPPAQLPPRRSLVLPLIVIIAALLIFGGSGYAYYAWNSRPIVAAAPTPTLTPAPTATTQPTAKPTEVPTPAPTDVPLISGTVVVTAAEGQTFVNTPANIEIIVDASGSMLATFEGSDKERWQVAQEALSTLVSSGTISDQSAVVVRTYGRRRGNDCNDLEVAQTLSRFNAEALQAVIGGIKPAVGGMTPLAASLRAASEDLQAAEGSTVVILVTDGLESCNGDPVAEAANFVKDTDQRKVHVIGFALGDQEASAKLRQIAEQGKGLYFDANNSAQLTDALRQTIVLSYQITTLDGEPVAAGTVGSEPVEIQPGEYKLKINANPEVEKDLVVENGGNVVVSLRQGFGGLVAEVDQQER